MRRKNKRLRRRIGMWALLTALGMMLCITSCAATKMHQEQARSHASMGLAYLQAGDATAALREFMEAEKYGPDDPSVHYYLGIAYYMKGIREEAIGQFKKTLEMKPDYSEAHNYLGTVYLESGQHDKAIEEFQLALANILYETPALTLYNMGRAYFEKGDNAAALAHFRQALEKRPTAGIIPHIHYYIGMVHLNANRVDEALRSFQKSLEFAPGLVDPLLQSGVCHMKKGDVPSAVTAFRKVIAAAPDSTQATAAAYYLKYLGQ